jgi:hypothetical protein
MMSTSYVNNTNEDSRFAVIPPIFRRWRLPSLA